MQEASVGVNNSMRVEYCIWKRDAHQRYVRGHGCYPLEQLENFQLTKNHLLLSSTQMPIYKAHLRTPCTLHWRQGAHQDIISDATSHEGEKHSMPTSRHYQMLEVFIKRRDGGTRVGKKKRDYMHGSLHVLCKPTKGKVCSSSTTTTCKLSARPPPLLVNSANDILTFSENSCVWNLKSISANLQRNTKAN